VDASSAFFAPDGILARVHPAYEHRPGQQQMAREVGATLENGGTLMVEAGTGTGKTLAYLVPALLSRRRIVISTGTRNLQDQLYNQDLPLLRERAGMEFSACVMKGRENYLCRYRLAEFEREPLLEDLSELSWLPRIAEWSRTTGTGDRAEIAEMPDGLKLWRDVNARADTCTGSRCPEFEQCWLTRLKRRAQQARLVLVNHHLFFADMAVRTAFGAVLPDYDTVIFDEAHLLEEVATLYFGIRVSAGQFEELARAAEREAVRSGGPTQGGGGAARLRQAAAEFFLELRDSLGDEQGRVRFEPAERGGPDLEEEWVALAEALEEVSRGATGGGEPGEATESLARRADELRDSLERVLARDDRGFVYGAERRGRANFVLSASPIDVSEILRGGLFDELHAGVLTSATLAVGGSFGFFQGRLGLSEARCLVVDSSFDHREQALLYLPRAMPEPRNPAFVRRAVDEITALLEISGGQAFLLFTSYAMMHRVHEALEGLGRWTLFLQGEGSKAALVESFKRATGAALLGTTSFWHGVDVPGEALSLVVVDKLPFDVPSDPLIAARIERIQEAEGNPFFEYQVPLAVLELKQGLGRLLRSRSDRGMLCVLDPRLVTRRYGRVFLSSLPPYRVVRDRESCARFFRGEDS
jgi:ATP-dependent DNA helicase DinG